MRAIGTALREGKLIRLPPNWGWRAQPTRAGPAIWAVYPSKKTASSKVRAFIDFRAALYRREGYREN